MQDFKNLKVWQEADEYTNRVVEVRKMLSGFTKRLES